MAERKIGAVGWFSSGLLFSFYAYIPLFLRIVSLHILRLKNETNVPFDLIKNTYFHSHWLQNSACGCRHFNLLTSGGAQFSSSSQLVITRSQVHENSLVRVYMSAMSS